MPLFLVKVSKIQIDWLNHLGLSMLPIFIFYSGLGRGMLGCTLALFFKLAPWELVGSCLIGHRQTTVI